MGDRLSDAKRRVSHAVQHANEAQRSQDTHGVLGFVRMARDELAAAEELLSASGSSEEEAGWVPVSESPIIPAWLDIDVRFADGSMQSGRASVIATAGVVAYRVRMTGVEA